MRTPKAGLTRKDRLLRRARMVLILLISCAMLALLLPYLVDGARQLAGAIGLKLPVSAFRYVSLMQSLLMFPLALTFLLHKRLFEAYDAEPFGATTTCHWCHYPSIGLPTVGHEDAFFICPECRSINPRAPMEMLTLGDISGHRREQLEKLAAKLANLSAFFTLTAVGFSIFYLLFSLALVICDVLQVAGIVSGRYFAMAVLYGKEIGRPVVILAFSTFVLWFLHHLRREQWKERQIAFHEMAFGKR